MTPTDRDPGSHHRPPRVAARRTYRIATGPHAGRKVATVQTLPADADAVHGDAGQVGGFSLHAGVTAHAHERDKLERLCRYIARPAIASMRLSISSQGRVRYQLKTPWKNGTTHVEFEPIDCIAKLAALVPPPRAHLTRFHGIFAPNANLRAQLTPAGRGRRPAIDAESTAKPTDDRKPAERRRSMTWAQRLKRVFGIDVTTCIHCGGAVRIVAKHRRAQGDSRHTGPRRKTWRAGGGALPARAAWTAGGGRLSAGRQDACGKAQTRARCGDPPQGCALAEGESRRERERENACRGDPPGHEPRSQTPDLRRTGPLRDRRLPGRRSGRDG